MPEALPVEAPSEPPASVRSVASEIDFASKKPTNVVETQAPVQLREYYNFPESHADYVADELPPAGAFREPPMTVEAEIEVRQVGSSSPGHHIETKPLPTKGTKRVIETEGDFTRGDPEKWNHNSDEPPPWALPPVSSYHESKYIAYKNRVRNIAGGELRPPYAPDFPEYDMAAGSLPPPWALRHPKRPTAPGLGGPGQAPLPTDAAGYTRQELFENGRRIAEACKARARYGTGNILSWHRD